jgi:hypothetical protein
MRSLQVSQEKLDLGIDDLFYLLYLFWVIVITIIFICIFVLYFFNMYSREFINFEMKELMLCF